VSGGGGSFKLNKLPKMKNIKFLLVCFVLFYSCQKDNIEQNSELHNNDLHSQHVLESRSIDLNHYIGDIEEYYKVTNVEVPVTLLSDIKNSLFDLSDYSDYEQVISSYGTLRWNWSSLNGHSQDFYYVTIPIFQDEKIRAFLRYYHIDNHFHFELVSLNEIRQYTNNYTDMPSDEKYVEYLSSYQRSQYLSNGLVNTRINNFLKDFYYNLPPDRIIPRNEITTAEIEITYIEIDPNIEIMGRQVGHLVTERINIFTYTKCGGGGGGGGGGGNSGGGTSGNGNGGNEEEEEEEEEEIVLEKEIKITDEECKKKMTEQAVDLLENELLGMDFPCENGDHQAILDDIVEALCTEAAAGNNGIEGAGGTSITLDRVNEALGGYDYIIEEESFINCETYKCVSDYLNANSLINYCQDMDPLFDSENIGVRYTTHTAGADGTAEISNLENGEITISVHSGDCDPENTDYLFVAETLYHEGQHALFYMELINSGLDTNDETEIQEAWANYASSNFDIPYNSQHEVMRDQYMDKAAEFLWELNGRILSKEHYKKYVYDGLKEWFDFPSSDVAQWEDNYKELNGIDPYTNDQNSFSCD